MPDQSSDQPAAAPLSHGTALDDMVLVAEVVASLKSRGILVLGTDGHYAFVNPTSQAIVDEVADLEALVREHQVEVPANIDRVLKSLGLILPMLGVK